MIEGLRAVCLGLGLQKALDHAGGDLGQPETGDGIRQEVLRDRVRVAGIGRAGLGVGFEPPAEQVAQTPGAVAGRDGLETEALPLTAALDVDREVLGLHLIGRRAGLRPPLAVRVAIADPPAIPLL